MKWMLPAVALACVVAVSLVVILSPAGDVPSGEADMEKKTSYVNDAYVIELDSNPTTGYDWAIISAEGLNVQKNYKAKQTDPMICGAGGTAIFTVTADSPGTYKLVLSYERSFQKDSSIRTETFDIEFK